MLNIILVDDDSKFLELIEKEIKKFFMTRDYAYKLYTFNDYNEEFFKLSSIPLENKLLLLDIKTPSGNGIDVSRKIRQYDQVSDILFLTAHNTREYKDMIVINNIKSMGFIHKKDIIKNFHKKMEEYLNNVLSNYHIVFKDGTSKYAIPIKDIFYVTTNKAKRKTVIHTVSTNIEVSLTLGEVEKILLEKSNCFIKIHRSYIINIMRVISLNVTKKSIVFSDNEEINSISRKHKKELLQIFSSYHQTEKEFTPN